MATKTTATFKVTINGRVEKRSSERPYTHAVLILRDAAKAQARAAAPYDKKTLALMTSNYHFAVQHSTPGSYGDPTYDGLTVRNARDTANGLEGYIALQKADDRAKLDRSIAQGEYTWHVAQWSMSAKNAATGARKFQKFGHQVLVVEVGTTHTLPGDVTTAD